MNQKQGFYQVDTERMDMEAKRPMDWQDKVVIGGSIAVIVICLLLLVS